LQLRYAASTSQTTINQVDLTPFKGEWVEVTELVTYGDLNAGGAYSIVIKRLSDNMILMNYANSNMDTWKTSADFMRPKWGIYRKNTQTTYLRDEQILFANFSINENPETLSVNDREITAITVFPNPTSNTFTVTSTKLIDGLELFDLNGKLLIKEDVTTIDMRSLNSGIYFIKIYHEGTSTTKKIIKL